MQTLPEGNVQIGCNQLLNAAMLDDEREARSARRADFCS